MAKHQIMSSCFAFWATSYFGGKKKLQWKNYESKSYYMYKGEDYNVL